MTLLVVDLCGTLVHENTTHGFLAALDGTGAWQRRLLLSRAGLAAGHGLPMLRHRDRLIASLRGLSKPELERQARLYAGAALARNGRQEIIAKLRAPGQEVILASASLDVVVAAFAEALCVRRWVATELEYDKRGTCLGRIRSDATGRKRQLVEHLLHHALDAHIVITDNPEDTDLVPGARRVEFLDAARS